MTGPTSDLPLIVCPLPFERRCAERTVRRGSVRIVCCGPGAAAVTSWAERHRRQAPPDVPVILLGLAGGLHDGARAGSARSVRRVVAPNGAWEPALPACGHGWVVTVASAVVRSTAAKRDLGARTGADVVDLESAAFAEAAVQAGWRWGIVRGVSDDVGDELPHEIERMLGEAGAVRIGAVASALLRRPALGATLMRLRRAAAEAMEAAARELEALLERSRDQPRA
jgi:nucleoside phosphorylase